MFNFRYFSIGYYSAQSYTKKKDLAYILSKNHSVALRLCAIVTCGISASGSIKACALKSKHQRYLQ